MHDPYTVAFDIHAPWRGKFGVHPLLLTIWHVDPQTDGSDDSCGWSFPRFSEAESKAIKRLAQDESKMLQISMEYHFTSDTLGLVYWAWRTVSSRIYKRPTFSYRELIQVIDLAYNPFDNLQHNCKPGMPDIEQLFWCVARCQKKMRRPWWKHPRWHIHHWRIQVHPFQDLWRWLFVRCDACGKRFPWGESISSIDGTQTYHHECLNEMVVMKKAPCGCDSADVCPMPPPPESTL